MNIEMILPEYRVEMAGAVEQLQEMAMVGKLTPKQFLDAERRVYAAYMVASMKRVVARLG